MEEGSTEDMPWGLQLIFKVLRKQLQTYTSLLTNHLAAATAGKSLQSCPTLCDPIDGSPRLHSGTKTEYHEGAEKEEVTVDLDGQRILPKETGLQSRALKFT